MNIFFVEIGILNTAIVIAVVSTLLAIAVLRPFALSVNLTDSPNKRKKHKGLIPLIGGLGMFLGFLISVIITPIDLIQIKFFLLSSFIIVIVGALDDHHDMAVRYRFFFQIMAALIISLLAGINIETLGNIFSPREELILNSGSLIVTIVAIIVAINALNMSDGIHGLAGCTSLCTFLSLAYFSHISDNQEGLIIASLMCAVILPFLFYNLNIGNLSEKRIFMGDAGSMFLGLGIVWLLIDLSQGESRSFSPVIALWLFAFPLMDAISTVLRRIILGQSPLRPDLSHLHHILIHIGVSSKRALIVIILFSLSMILIGVIGELNKILEWKMFVGFIVVFVIYSTLKYILISKAKYN